MHRVMCPIVIGLTAAAFVATAAGGAYASTAPAAAGTTAPCPAILAPKGMNPLPASDDCPAPGARATKVQTLVTPHAASTPISMTPLPFDRTNGDLLAITKIDGTNDLAFGGNFSLVYTPDGVSHSATNFAVVDEASGAFLYGGTAGGGTDKYVRSIGSLNGVIYVGGDFTAWGGVSRSHAVSLAPTGNPASPYSVTSWNPAPGARVRGLGVDSGAVYFGSGNTARAVNPTTGATIWSKSVSGGDVASVFAYQGYVFVGGLFNYYNGVLHPGLVKVNRSDGSLVTAFNAHMRANTGQGQYGAYDGEEVIALAPGPNAGEVLAGIGGHAPAGLSSNEAMLLDINTGARLMHYSTLGDCQAIGAVGNTTVAGYHNNTASASNPLSANYFGIQLENTTTGTPTTWDPRVNGNQSNADGGNNGIQAMYVDQSTQTIYLGGAFVHWNGTTGLTHQSLIAFSFASGSATAPGAPTGVSASAGDTTATVSWTAPANGGSPIQHYTVTSDPGGLTGTSAGAATSATVGGLTNGTAYTFTVVATNGVGDSAPSAPSNSVTPVAPTVPDAPTGVVASAGDGAASVHWTAPADGGSPIQHYTVTSDPGGLTGTSAGAATSATVGGLTNGTAYTFTVVATNGVGDSAPSAPSNSVTPMATTTTGQSNSAEGGTAGVAVTTSNSGGASGDAFSVVYKASGAGLVFASAAAAHGSLGYALTGSSGGTFMGWNGYSATSMAIRFYYNPGSTLPNSLLRLADVRNSSATAARVELSASNQIFIQNAAGTTLTTFSHALQANTRYRIELTISISSSAATINAAYYPADSTTPVDPAYSTTTGNTGTTNITQVSIGSAASATWTGTSYFDDLAADAGSTAFIGSVTPSAPTAPDAPTGVSASAGDGSATVSWSAPGDGGNPITGYTVTSSPDGKTGTTSGATSVTVAGLTNGTVYTFTVTATNGVGTSDPSAPSNSVTPSAPTAPDAPTGVSASAGDGSATVSWSAPGDGGNPITGYTVTSSPDGKTGTTSGATSVTVAGLTNGTVYTFTVTATNGVGTSDPSSPSNTVTPGAVTTTGQSNTAEGGTAGTSVTVANSGGTSGTAFTVVYKASGAALVFATAAAAHGSLGYALTGSSGGTFMGWNGYSATSMAIRFYYNPGPTLPSKVIRLADIRNSTSTAARVELSTSNQLFIQNAAGSTLTTFSHALQANTWYRIELTISISSSAATINAAYYPAASTTPVDPAYATTTGNTGTANITQVSIGSAASATWTGTSYFDDLAAEAGSTAFIGP